MDETNSGQNMFDILWKRTGKSSTHYLASWTNDFTVESEASMFGFSLFGEVECTGHNHNVPQGEIGIVVGFTQYRVEVQFQKRILRCLPKELQDLATRVQLVDSMAAVSQRVVRAQESRAPCRARSLTRAAPQSEFRCAQEPVIAATSSRTAKQIQSRAADAVGRDAKVPSTDVVVDKKRYHGVVKWSRGSMAWLTCEALVAMYPGCDVFLHRKDCDVMPKQWDNVSFQLTLDDKCNPKGIKATVENSQPPAAPTMISARDWFSERSKGFGMRKL